VFIPLRSVIGGTLRWKSRGWFRSVHELFAGTEVVARLTPLGGFTAAVAGETADDRWSLAPVGFWRSRIVVRHGDSESEDAALTPRFFGGGSVQLRDGRAFDWRSEDFWGKHWAMRDAAGAPIYRLKCAFLSLNGQAEVTIDPGGEREPALAILLLLGWYTALGQRRRSHAAG